MIVELRQRELDQIVMAQQNILPPPRTAVWLLTLFALAEEAESIQGDLLEEFSLLVSKSGVASARRWFWRQTMKTVPQLAGVGFRTAPWMTIAAVVGGFLLRKLLGPLVEPAIFCSPGEIPSLRAPFRYVHVLRIDWH